MTTQYVLFTSPCVCANGGRPFNVDGVCSHRHDHTRCGDCGGSRVVPADPRDAMIASLHAALVIAAAAIVDIVGAKWDEPKSRECIIANTALALVRDAIASMKP